MPIENTNLIVIILASVGVICLLTILFVKRKEVKDFLNSEACREFIKQACIKAEKEIVGTKKGQERLTAVCEAVLNFCPAGIKKYITTEMLVEAINEIFSTIAKKMEDGSTQAQEE